MDTPKVHAAIGKYHYDRRAVAVWRRYRKLINLAALARHLGITTSSVHLWTVVPEARVVRVAKIIGVEPEKLRPDIADFIHDPWED